VGFQAEIKEISGHRGMEQAKIMMTGWWFQPISRPGFNMVQPSQTY